MRDSTALYRFEHGVAKKIPDHGGHPALCSPDTAVMVHVGSDNVYSDANPHAHKHTRLIVM